MNQRTAKLLRKAAYHDRKNIKSLKREWNSLPSTQRWNMRVSLQKFGA